MKLLSNLLAALVFCSLIIFVNCGGGDDGGDTGPSETTAQIVAGQLVVTNWASQTASYEGSDSEGDWSGFSLDFSGDENGGTYNVSGVPTGYERVWDATGGGNRSWEFTDESASQVLRGDGVTMDVTVTDTSLTLSFSVPEEGNRTSGIVGSWTFTF